jgi:Ice-binding-like
MAMVFTKYTKGLKMTNSNYTRNDSNRSNRFHAAMFTIAFMMLPVLAAQTPVNLGTAGDFAILAKTGVSATGITTIIGNVGVSPVAATYVTGFGLIADISNTFWISSLVTGNIFAADNTDPTPAKMTAAVSDMEAAYTDAVGRVSPDYTELFTGDLTGRTLAPGLYKWSTGVLISAGSLTISGTANDVWVFQIAQNLELSSSAIVTLSGGAQASNVFWQVAGQTTLGTTASLNGIVLCKTAIVMNTGATLNGRAFAQTAVTLDANSVVQSTLMTSAKNGSTTQKSPYLLNSLNNNLEFVTSIRGRATLTILNLSGQKVVTLFNGDVVAGKINNVQFNSGNLSNGLYISELKSSGNVIRNMLIVR